MKRPTQGENWTVQPGEDLKSIATVAYLGSTYNWELIRDANQFKLKIDNQEQVQPGEVIFIPPDPFAIELQNIQDEL